MSVFKFLSVNYISEISLNLSILSLHTLSVSGFNNNIYRYTGIYDPVQDQGNSCPLEFRF